MTEGRSQVRRADHHGIRDALSRFDAPGEVVDGLLASLEEDDRGLLLYGSRARGDAIAGSDWDFLALTEHPRKSVYSGDVSLSLYGADELRTGIGTLFGVHLARDATLLWDPTGELAELLSAMGDVDTGRLITRCKTMSIVLGALDRDVPKYLLGLLREARYLLRSCLYALAIERGEPCFSVRELARKYGQTDFERLLGSRHSESPNVADLSRCIALLGERIGPLPANPHGSLEALIVNEWEDGGDVVAMAMMALGATGQEADYIEVEKILL